MTTEEYTCTACGHSFPTLAGQEHIACPRCGSAAVERVIALFPQGAEGLTPEDYFAKGMVV